MSGCAGWVCVVGEGWDLWGRSLPALGEILSAGFMGVGLCRRRRWGVRQRVPCLLPCRHGRRSVGLSARAGKTGRRGSLRGTLWWSRPVRIGRVSCCRVSWEEFHPFHRRAVWPCPPGENADGKGGGMGWGRTWGGRGFDRLAVWPFDRSEKMVSKEDWTTIFSEMLRV